jgi:hypothetical protein
MFKSIGLGICCLTFAFAGVSRADIGLGNNYGDKDNHFDVCPGSKLPDLGCDYKLVIDPCHITKGGNGVCNLTWLEQDHNSFCKLPVLDPKDPKGGCFTPPPCDPCGPQGGCVSDPSAVPAPASATFGGIGVLGIMIASALRSRKVAVK